MSKVFVLASHVPDPFAILDDDQYKAECDILFSSGQLTKKEFVKRMGQMYDKVLSTQRNVSVTMFYDVEIDEDHEDDSDVPPEPKSRPKPKLSVVKP